MGTIIGGAQGLTTESAYPTSSNANAQYITVTVTQNESEGEGGGTSSITPTSTAISDSGLVTAAPSTASSSMTLVYIYTQPTTASSPHRTPSSSSLTSGRHVSGLSPGAIAGIVIGSLAFLIILVFLVFCSSRGFARKKRRETLLHTGTSAGRSARSDYSKPRSVLLRGPPQELATQFNQLEIDGRGRPTEVVGSHLHPAELQATSMTDMAAAYTWKGKPPPPPPSPDVAVACLSPGGRGKEVFSEGGRSERHLDPGSWETVSSATVSGKTQAGPSTSTSWATSSDHTEAKVRKPPK